LIPFFPNIRFISANNAAGVRFAAAIAFATFAHVPFHAIHTSVEGDGAVNSQPTLFVALKNLGLFALLGFAVVLLAGPIIGVLSVLLSVGAVVLLFAVVGFLVWGAFQAAVKGPEAAMNGLKDVGERGQAFLNDHG
jgi:hypothetical protein